MSILLLKEIEDTKKILSDLNNQLGDKIDNRIQSKLAIAYSEFRCFFDENGFEVTETDDSITASYGTIHVELRFPDLNQSYFGAYAMFNLMVKIRKADVYQVSLHKKGSEVSPFGVTFTVVDSISGDSDSDTNTKELQRVQGDIEATKARIAGFSEEEWVFSLSTEKQSRFESFDSMKEILEFLVK